MTVMYRESNGSHFSMREYPAVPTITSTAGMPDIHSNRLQRTPAPFRSLLHAPRQFRTPRLNHPQEVVANRLRGAMRFAVDPVACPVKRLEERQGGCCTRAHRSALDEDVHGRGVRE